VLPKRWPNHGGAFVGNFSHACAFEKLEDDSKMEQPEKTFRNKGGRPLKAVTKNKTMTFKCSGYERIIIQAKAKKTKRTTSEYLREIALTGKIETKEKHLPKEVLDLTGTLNHMAANLNQIAKLRNSGIEELTAMEILTLKWQSDELRELAQKIKKFIS
jgi:hypothetical protein